MDNQKVLCDWCGKGENVKNKWFNFELAEEYLVCDFCLEQVKGGYNK